MCQLLLRFNCTANRCSRAGRLSRGCGTLAVDAFGAEENPVHYTLPDNEGYIVENLKNLDKLPPFCFFMAFQLKIKDGSGSPVREVALVPKEG